MNVVFTDIGGVILTNGWDRKSRKKACEQFGIDTEAFDKRHSMYEFLLEIGKITLREYLDNVVFYQPRTFSAEDFIHFMKEQSHPFPEMLDMYKNLKKQYGFRLVAVSNESAALAKFRAEKFKLLDLFDAYVVSAFIGLRKPDKAFYELALSLVQKEPHEVLYIDDRDTLCDAGKKMGLKAWQHQDVASSRQFIEDNLCKVHV